MSESTATVTTRDPARSYHRWQFRIGVSGYLISAAYLGALLVTGLSTHLRDLLTAWTSQWWLAVSIAVLLIGLGQQILTLPLSLIGGFWLPRRYGLHHQSFVRWAIDRSKAGLIGIILGGAAVLIIYALLRSTPWWWLWAAAALFVGQVLIAFVTPIWLVPIFYRLIPLPEGDLRSRLLRLAERAGVPAIGVYIADQSRRSRTANAAVVGLGRTRRIILFDTLVAEFSPDQIESVLAHELGHHAHADMRRGLLVSGALTFVTAWLAALALDGGVGILGLAGPADPAGLPWLALVALVLGLVQLPLANGFSRWIERQR